jgi:hypothetical protein
MTNFSGGPSTLVTVGVNTSQDNHFIFRDRVDNQVWKWPRNCTAQITAEHLVLIGIAADCPKPSFNRLQKVITKTTGARIVPSSRLCDLKPRKRPDD